MPSRMPAAVKLKWTGGLRPTGFSTTRNSKPPPGGLGTATTLRVTGSRRVPGAMTRAGSVVPAASLTGSPVRLKRLNPPSLKKPRTQGQRTMARAVTANADERRLDGERPADRPGVAAQRGAEAEASADHAIEPGVLSSLQHDGAARAIEPISQGDR